MYARDQLVILSKKHDKDSKIYRIIKIISDRIVNNYILTDELIVEPKSVRSTINNFRDVVKQMEDNGGNPPAIVSWSDKIRDFKDTKVLNVWQREELEELLLRLKFVKFVETW